MPWRPGPHSDGFTVSQSLAQAGRPYQSREMPSGFRRKRTTPPGFDRRIAPGVPRPAGRPPVRRRKPPAGAHDTPPLADWRRAPDSDKPGRQQQRPVTRHEPRADQRGERHRVAVGTGHIGETRLFRSPCRGGPTVSTGRPWRAAGNGPAALPLASRIAAMRPGGGRIGIGLISNSGATITRPIAAIRVAVSWPLAPAW